MENKKYELTDETKKYNGSTLYRIKALKDFGNIKAGDLGGYVESENNLSQEGDCWVIGDSLVLDNARVVENAYVSGNTIVKDFTRVCGNAFIFGKVELLNNVHISGNAKISGEVALTDNVIVEDNAKLSGKIAVTGNTIFRGDTVLDGEYYIQDLNSYCAPPTFKPEPDYAAYNSMMRISPFSNLYK